MKREAATVLGQIGAIEPDRLGIIFRHEIHAEMGDTDLGLFLIHNYLIPIYRRHFVCIRFRIL